MKTSNTKIIFLFLFVCAVIAEDEFVFDGKCPEEVSTAEKFDYDKFSGLWYEIKRYPNAIVSEQCAAVKYTLLRYNNYNLTYLSINIEAETRTKRQLVYDKEIVQSPDIKYDVYFKCKKDNFQHLIIDTDYITYSVVWGCLYNAKEGTNTQRLFIYSRTQTLDDVALQAIEEKLEKYGIDHNRLVDVEQKYDKCGSVILEPPIWNGCPDATCSELECTRPTKS